MGAIVVRRPEAVGLPVPAPRTPWQPLCTQVSGPLCSYSERMRVYGPFVHPYSTFRNRIFFL